MHLSQHDVRPSTTARVMNSLLGVGGHLLSGEMEEFSYTISKYSRKWEMAEDPEVAGAEVIRERVLVPVHTFNGTTFHFGIPFES